MLKTRKKLEKEYRRQGHRKWPLTDDLEEITKGNCVAKDYEKRN